MALLVLGHPSLVKAEESSILEGASVSSAISSGSADPDVILNGSFKSYIATASSNNPVEIAVELSQPEKVIEVVVLAGSHNPNFADRIGGSEIILTNSVTSEEIVAKSEVYDSGIYKLDQPGEANSIIVRRTNGNHLFALAHLRAY